MLRRWFIEYEIFENVCQFESLGYISESMADRKFDLKAKL